MSIVTVEVDIKPAQQAMLALGGVFQQQPYLALVGQRLLAWVNQNFVQHGAEIPWAPLSPNTIASRRGGGVGAQPLRDTGRMAQSFGPGQPDSAYEIGPGYVVVGTNDRKAVWHHYGTKPYIIRPMAKTTLRFIMATPQKGAKHPKKARGGFYTYDKEIHHPGLPARPLIPSQILAERLATDVLTAYLEEVTRGLR